jgi:hypothetical protein
MAAHRGELADAVAMADRAVQRVGGSDMLNLSAGVWLAVAEVRRTTGAKAASDAAVAEAIRLYGEKGNVAAAEGVHSRSSTL